MRQIDRVEVLGNGENLLDILSIRLTNPKRGGHDRGTLPRVYGSTLAIDFARPVGAMSRIQSMSPAGIRSSASSHD